MVIDPEEIDTEDFGRLGEIDNALVLLCMATYGEGDPTDNAQQLHEYIQSTDAELKGVRYAVCGGHLPSGNPRYRNPVVRETVLGP